MDMYVMSVDNTILKTNLNLNQMKLTTLLLLIPLNLFCHEQINQRPEPEFNFEEFKELVFELCEYPVIVCSQAILESGNFTSNVWKTKNNPFGIRMYKVSEDKWIYRPFNTWQESVQYYADFQNRKYKGGDYFVFLEELPYAMDPLYINKVKQIVLSWD